MVGLRDFRSSRCQGARITRSVVGPLKRTSSKRLSPRDHTHRTGVKSAQHSDHVPVPYHCIDQTHCFRTVLVISVCSATSVTYQEGVQDTYGQTRFAAFDPLASNSPGSVLYGGGGDLCGKSFVGTRLSAFFPILRRRSGRFNRAARINMN